MTDLSSRLAAQCQSFVTRSKHSKRIHLAVICETCCPSQSHHIRIGHVSSHSYFQRISRQRSHSNRSRTLKTLKTQLASPGLLGFASPGFTPSGSRFIPSDPTQAHATQPHLELLVAPAGFVILEFPLTSHCPSYTLLACAEPNP
jgi:hypothetical protein